MNILLKSSSHPQFASYYWNGYAYMKFKVILILLLNSFLVSPVKAENFIQKFLEENKQDVALVKACRKELLAVGLIAGGVICPLIQSAFRRGLPTPRMLGISAVSIATALLMREGFVKAISHSEAIESKELAEIIGCEDQFDIPTSDGRNTIIFTKETLTTFLKEEKNPFRSWGAQLIDFAAKKLGFAQKKSLEYQEIKSKIKNSCGEIVEIEKKYLPHILKHIHGEGLSLIFLVNPVGMSFYINPSNNPQEASPSYHAQEPVTNFIYSVGPLDRRILKSERKIHRDEDGTPTILKKNDDGTESIDEESMQLCGLHGIPWSSLKPKNSANSAIASFDELPSSHKATPDRQDE